MIIKLSDVYDLELLKQQMGNQIPQIVINSLEERFCILEEIMGPYLHTAYGFAVTYLITEDTKDPDKVIEEILDFYNLGNDKDFYEYSEIVGENISSDDSNYRETLYLTGNGEISVLFMQELKREVAQIV